MRGKVILERVGGYDPEAPATHHDPTLERERDGRAQFVLHAALTVGVFKVVEASDEAEARERAESLGAPALCAHCVRAGGRHADSWQLSDGLEGEAELIEVERA